jgi:multidrug efflux pump subunit AcrB
MKATWRERFNISRLAVQYSRLTIALWIAVMVAGMLAFSSLKYGLFPDISFPVVVVSAQAPFEMTLETESALTKPLEAKLQALADIDDVYSSTYPGQAVINVLFLPGSHLEEATTAVKTSLSELSLPPQASVEVIPYDLNESPTISYALKSDRQSLEQLSQIANDQIIPKINQLPGVLKVNLLGEAATANPPQPSSSSSVVPNFPTQVRFEGQDVLAFQVVKRSKANALDVVSQVERTVEQLKSQFPDLELILAESQAGYIREAIRVTLEDLFLAIVLAVLVIFFFLRTLRATLIPALAIPTSLLGTFIVMASCGYNLETITLLALALVIGIVVDDAIVDVENITRLIDRGERPLKAVIQGTNEIGLTVTASTLTIVAVFLPVGLMGGTLGKFFNPFGVTISAAVLFSLFVARTLSPVLAVYWLKPNKKRQAAPADGKGGERLQVLIANSYRDLLRWSLHHRRIVVGIALLSFIAGVALIPLIPKGFVPSLDRGEFNIIYTTPLPKLPSGLTLKALPEKAGGSQAAPRDSGSFDWLSDLAKSPQRLLLRRAYRVGKQFEAVVLASPSVESTFTTVGIRAEGNRGKIYVRLKRDRALTTAQVQEQLRQSLPALKGVTVSVEDIPFVQTEAEKPLQIALLGDDLQQLRQTAQLLKTRTQTLPGLADIALSDRKNEGDNLVEIQRLNGKRAIYLSANLSQNQALEDAAQTIEQIAQPLLPPGIALKRWGSSAHSNDLLTKFGGTMAIAVILMLLVLILLFGRLLEPLAIGLSLPLSIVGAMLGLLVTQSDFGVVSLIGLIFLVGLLSKNGILLMDYANQLRQAGKSREDAILESGRVRLRPIFMTTAATILGMVPIALGFGAGAELRQPMAVAIMGGLATSTLLSLIVVPVLYTLLEDLWSKAGDKKR